MAKRNADGTVTMKTTGKLSSTPKVGFSMGIKASPYASNLAGGGMNARLLTTKRVVVAATSAWRPGSSGGQAV